ncbi:hypothetical protein LIER_32663 [Lithospermum erythrorhizon]|uniref:RNase H type-1 domain-containing protein n=1 Tax=Lithospermum erythrorhizon TaxID=34254 RepID=A0AAV3RXW4_LITER
MANLLQYKNWKGDLNVAALYGVNPKKPIRRQPMVIAWQRPRTGYLKLNIDGAFKSNKRGLGGILRNAAGDMEVILGFFASAAPASPLETEILAMNNGVPYVRS